MGEIVQFVSRADLAARENLDAFVRLAQHKLTAFSEDGAWDEVTWRNDRTSAVFCKYRPRSKSNTTPVPLAEPFLTFAKAYVRYRYSHKPVTSMAPVLNALRMIELALLQATGRADILDLSVPVLDESARYCAKFKRNKTAQYHGGRHIEAIANFCREHWLVPVLPSWKSPFTKQRDLTEALTEEGARHRERKLPTNEQMLALADLFAQADDVESQYFTSIAALLMVAPGRISEVLALPVDCIGWDEESSGEKQMYLRWRAAKGGGAGKKWVPAVMQSVVEEAVARLTRIGAPARDAARFAYENPGRYMLHAACTTSENFGEEDVLEPAQVAAAVGVKYQDAHGWGGVPATWARLHRDGPVTYRVLADVSTSLYKGSHWPYINARKEVVAWNALCLVREFEYRSVISARPFSWRLAGTGAINDRLGRRKEFSLFERVGLRNPDGSPIKLTTHQLRHWLSTMAARAGMDDYTLARWAGRTRIEDNRHYDHRTQEERNAEVRALLHPQQATTLEKYDGGRPITYREAGVDRLGVVKVTLYGMCVHDFSMLPCQKQRKCMTCNEHVCIKGAHVTLERIKKLEDTLEERLKKAREAAIEGVFGAVRWVDDVIWELSLTRTMRKMLEAGPVPDGTILRIPAEYDPSPVRRTLMELNVIDAPSLDDIPVQRVFPVLEGPNVA